MRLSILNILKIYNIKESEIADDEMGRTNWYSEPRTREARDKKLNKIRQFCKKKLIEADNDKAKWEEIIKKTHEI
tara:strand:- start:269 stop:493 length:225 start_codon:yes stop_codon:yes gene_type:complete